MSFAKAHVDVARVFLVPEEYILCYSMIAKLLSEIRLITDLNVWWIHFSDNGLSHGKWIMYWNGYDLESLESLIRIWRVIGIIGGNAIHMEMLTVLDVAVTSYNWLKFAFHENIFQDKTEFNKIEENHEDSSVIVCIKQLTFDLRINMLLIII